jgi:hypothetical protein
MVNTLTPYIPSSEKPWNARRVQHLYQRLAFGTDWDTIQNGLSQSPQDLVNQLISTAANLPEPDEPFWALWSYDDYPQDDMQTYFQVKSEFFQRWIQEMIQEGVRSKLALFWHNHFVTREETYECNTYMWTYYRVLHNYAFGDFKEFVEQMGLTPAMLVFLNGNLNVAAEPNENYARELMELFTMGEGNGYTQDDIVEVSRALTGYQINMYACQVAPFFNPGLYDQTPKTIFGQTGNWNYLNVHDLIFEYRQEEVANFICGKLYKFYVYEEIDENIVQGLAQTFIDNNWQIEPVLRQLFSSEHFYEERFINARIKSPLESLISTVQLTGAELNTNFDQNLIGTITYGASNLGQEVFNPVDVAGWQEHHTWLSENTMTRRWSLCTNILNNIFNFGSGFLQNDFRTLAVAVSSPDETDPLVVTQGLVRHFLNRDLDDNLLQIALQYFKGEIPENYFQDGTWTVNYADMPAQVLNLLFYLVRLPEWQLC